MRIAIVILNWNGKKLLEQFLPSIIKNSNLNDCNIYVADNASSDDSISFLKNNFSTVKIIENQSNGGYAKGYNDALSNIDADIYALINSDIEVTEKWLVPILSEFKKNINTAVIQPKILDFNDKMHFEYAGAAGGFIDEFGYPFCRGRIFNTLEKDENQYNNTSSIFWASGACLFVRSKIFNELNGFDEDFFAHQEEIDLCWRIYNKGLEIKYVGSSEVFHVGGATLSTSNPQKTFLNFRNSLFNLAKNLPKKSLFPIIFMRLILDGIAGIKFLFELKPKHTWAIVRAHFSFYKNLSRMLKKRTNNSFKTKYYFTRSMLWQYYIKRIRSFSKIQ